jgi:bifunctional non-homologous end joining protein LigD
VIGGWTEPRQTRSHFGALLLGVYVPEASDDDGRSTSDQRLPTADDDRPSTSDHRLSTAADHRPPTTDHRLEYVGHTGTGFDQAELTRVWKLLKPRETPASPFAGPVPSNERPHWVRPELVAQVRFTEWTDDRKLRHPVYLGLRDDKAPESVVDDDGIFANNHMPKKPTGTGSEARAAGRKRYGKAAPSPGRAAQSQMAALAPVIEQLRTLEHNRKDGTVTLPDGSQLGVTNLWKVFWPQAKLTKGDLLRYYATVSPFILPAVADRPLVMKRFPNGVDAPAFYQQRSRLEKPPGGVRILQLPPEHEPASEPDFRRFIGGSLITLLYTTQIAAISQDPWFSRVQHPLDADYVALDLDPDDDAPFERVLEVARYLRDELESLKVPAVPKTSGSSGLHIYIPLPPGTSYESGMLFCQIVATIVAARHPRIATVERKVKARARGTVYVDYLQNILGKTLATAYSARASAFAGVSTPLEWKELDEKIDPRDFTITTAPARFAEVGDLWARLRTSKPANLEAVFRKYAQ